MIKYSKMCCFFLFAFLACSEAPTSSMEQPNVLLIIADDLGYTDLGCYGGEIKTPTIDSLASTGMLFTNFHTGAMCAPSRSMLFTGQEHHLAGWGRQRDVSGTFYEGKWGYENELSDRVLSFPRILQDENYATCFAGKWHLGKSNKSDPYAQGFDQSFALLQGAANHWNDVGLGLSEFDGKQSLYTRNGKKASWPFGKFSTEVYTNEILNFIRAESTSDKPFFAVASYTAPHWPLQPPNDFIDKYKGVYRDGYEDLRKRRLEASKIKGITDQQIELPEGLSHIKEWDSLSSEEQANEARKMELYAAMLEHLDTDIGRLINGLKQSNRLDNTIIIFMSDNGADFLDFYNHPIGNFIRANYNNEISNMGDSTSFVAYGPQWAQAGMSPYSYYKGYLAEGGVRAPLIVSGPGVAKGEIEKQFLHVMDVAPTILELTNLKYKQEFKGEIFPPLHGKSFAQAIRGMEVKLHSGDEFFIDDFQGMASVLQGDFKLFNQEDPADESKFKLFDLRNDPGEKINIRDDYPQKVDEMLIAWRDYRETYRIVYPDSDESLNPYKEKQ